MRSLSAPSIAFHKTSSFPRRSQWRSGSGLWLVSVTGSQSASRAFPRGVKLWASARGGRPRTAVIIEGWRQGWEVGWSSHTGFWLLQAGKCVRRIIGCILEWTVEEIYQRKIMGSTWQVFLKSCPFPTAKCIPKTLCCKRCWSHCTEKKASWNCCKMS